MNQQDREFNRALKESNAYKVLWEEVVYLRKCIGLAPHIPQDPPLSVDLKPGGINRRRDPYGDRRRDICGGRRLSAGERRVDRTRTLYINKGLHGFEPAGMYEAMDGEVKPDRRIKQRRSPKIFGKQGRRTTGFVRRKK